MLQSKVSCLRTLLGSLANIKRFLLFEGCMFREDSLHSSLLYSSIGPTGCNGIRRVKKRTDKLCSTQPFQLQHITATSCMNNQYVFRSGIKPPSNINQRRLLAYTRPPSGQVWTPWAIITTKMSTNRKAWNNRWVSTTSAKILLS